jgi:hypothetical protein
LKASTELLSDNLCATRFACDPIESSSANVEAVKHWTCSRQ